MIDVLLRRYYGDVNVTKSTLIVMRGEEELFRCEARELGFVDYTDEEKRRGVSYKCLPRGVFPLKLWTMPFNECCLKTHHTHTHRGTVVYADPGEERKHNAVLVGYADESVAAERRKLTDVERCREEFNKVISELWGEEFRLKVENETNNRPSPHAPSRKEGGGDSYNRL